MSLTICRRRHDEDWEVLVTIHAPLFRVMIRDQANAPQTIISTLAALPMMNTETLGGFLHMPPDLEIISRQVKPDITP